MRKRVQVNNKLFQVELRPFHLDTCVSVRPISGNWHEQEMHYSRDYMREFRRNGVLSNIGFALLAREAASDYDFELAREAAQ